MSRPTRLATLLLALALGLPLAPATRAQAVVPDVPQAAQRPAPEFAPLNVLLLIGDDMGVETVGVYDEHPMPGRTPVLDALAGAGVLFRNAWSSPTCSPTRANLLTGRLGWRTGIGSAIAYADFDLELSVDEITLADVLAARGYRTAATGKWHLAAASVSGPSHPLRLGFEHHRGSPENLPNADETAYFDFEKFDDGSVVQSTTYATSDVIDDTLGYIEEFGNEPWFLYVALNPPHTPYHKPPRGLHTYDLPPNVSDSFPLHAYAMAEAMDTEIARLLQSMDPLVLARTLIVFVGDNGTAKPAVLPPYTPEHAKNTCYEGGVNVPLIVAGPGVAAGGESAALVHCTDLFATLCELTGADASAALDSVSFADTLALPGLPSPRPWVYTDRFRPNGAQPWVEWERAVRDDQHKLRARFQNGDPLPTELELYDLQADPLEAFNLLSDGISPAEAALLQQFQAVMQGIGP